MPKPLVTSRVLLVWCSARGFKTDVWSQIGEDMLSVEFVSIFLEIFSGVLSNRYAYFHAELVDTEMIIKQKGHSKGPLLHASGILGTRRRSEAAVEVANDVCEYPVSDL